VQLRFYPFDLKFRHPFRIAAGTRSTTAVVFTEITLNGCTGYGEAALPPYLQETQQSVAAFLEKVDLSSWSDSFKPEEVIGDINRKLDGNKPALASLDMALFDLYGKLNNLPVHRIWVNGIFEMPLNSYTLGMDTPAMLTDKLKEAKDAKLLKVKLGGKHDALILKTLRENTRLPICVDANQGWKDEFEALDLIEAMAEQNVIFVEQPLPKEEKRKSRWLKTRSPLPIIGDESIQGYDDLHEAAELFHGINIKLMKCGGLLEAYRMIIKAKDAGLKILIGCMSESSCGVSAAAQLAPFADWTDLDGPLLITNDPFTGITYKKGRIVLPESPGCGVEKRSDHDD
jgi:L-alanine-DL-glutamate epimerase-like enolase superfamily enzyme